MKIKKKKEAYTPKTGVLGNASDYNVYRFSVSERLITFIVGMVAVGGVLYIFFESVVASLVLGIIGGFLYQPIRLKQKLEKRKKTLLLQFKDLLEALDTSLGAGRNVFDAFTAAEGDLGVQYPPDADIISEVRIILQGIAHNRTVEEMLKDFADRCGLSEVDDFASVFAVCYRKGGNIQQVIHNTTEVISDEIEIGIEIQTMVAGQKTEQNVMMVMPIIFVLMMKSMGGGLVDLSSPVGVISMSIAIALFVVAYFVGKKILDIKL